MELTGNTILITGGGSGIGRGLAEALHTLGNQVVIAGRRQQVLDETTKANPGMRSVILDIGDANSIKGFAARVVTDFPALNVLINNAGIAKPENLAADAIDVADAEAMVTTNVLGPIRLTAALLPQLRKQQKSTVMMVSSGLAFVPLAMMPTYCATKAALHSYTESLRYQLKATSVELLELVPPYVQTELGGERQKTDPRAMPLDEFIAETMAILKAGPPAGEINVKKVYPLRNAEGDHKYADVFMALNEAMSADH